MNDEVMQDADFGGFIIEEQLQTAKKENEGRDVHIHGVDERPMYDLNKEPVVITVAGAHSDYMRRAEQESRKRKLNPRRLTGEYIYDDNIEKAAACTLGWRGFYSRRVEGGDPIVVPFSPKAVKELYKRCPWVLDQVLEAINDHKSFFENSSSTE